jgi:hypothetical protein
MSDIAIRVEGLGKAYRIGLKEQQHETMLGAMAAWLKSPLKNFREVRSLSQFEDAKMEDGRSKIGDQGGEDSRLKMADGHQAADGRSKIEDLEAEDGRRKIEGALGEVMRNRG